MTDTGTGIKTIHIPVTENEFNRLKKLKGEMTWNEFIRSVK